MARAFSEKISERLLTQSGSTRRARRLKALLYGAVFLPLLAASVYAVQDLYGDLTLEAIKRRTDVGTVAASLAGERISDLTDAAGMIASQASISEAVTRGEWRQAAELAAQHRENTALTGHLVLVDQAGIIKADADHPEDAGKDDSGQAWFKDLSSHWVPSISAANDPYSKVPRTVLMVSIPLRSPDDQLLGALAAQADPNELFGELSGVIAGSGGDLYITDRNGRLIFEPSYLASRAAPDFSRLSYVQDAIRGRSGSVTADDPFSAEPSLISYEPIADYEWSLVISDPQGVVFADRTHDVSVFSVAYALFAAADGAILYILLSVLVAVIAARRREAAFLESIADGVAATDPARNITMWNRSAERLTGWSAADALGKPARDFLKLIRERDRQDNSAFIEESLTQRKPRTMEERTVLIKRDGGEMPVGAAAAPILDENGRAAGLIVVFRDLTGERQSQLIRSDLAYASHQLRTPVTEAFWSIEMAKEEKDPVVKQAKIEAAETSLQSVRKLAEEIIEVSRLDQRMEIPQLEAVTADGIMAQAAAAVKDKADRRKAAIAVAPAPAATVRTDPRMLTRILTELLDNALEYGESGARIGLRAATHEAGLLFEVIDDGPGIPRAEQPLVFTKFFRGSNRRQESAGAGLGLYISQGYAKLLEGRIWFESEPGQGATFRLYVPSIK